MKIFEGLVAAPFTPMHADGTINPDVVDRYVDVLVEQGVNGAFANGSTGEGISLTLDERKKMAEKWMSAGKGKLDHVIIHIGTNNLQETKELARHAASIGADAISVLPPSYFKPPTVSALVTYLAGVAGEAPDVPMLYYHIPEMTGVDFSMIDLMEEASKKIPTFAGLKFTALRMDDFGLCAEKFGDRMTLLYGKDEQLVCALALGGSGAVGSTYNYAGKLNRKIMAAIKSGNLNQAVQYQFKAQRFLQCMFRHGLTIGLNKSVAERVTGIPLGPPRLPLLPASEEKKTALFKDLESIGFFDCVK